MRTRNYQQRYLTIKNLEMKKFRFTMGTLILAMMATAFMACNKDKETTVMPQRTAAIDMSNLAIF